MTIKEFIESCRTLQGAFRKKMGEPMGVGPWQKTGTVLNDPQNDWTGK